MIELATTGSEGEALHLVCDGCNEILDTGQHNDDKARDAAAGNGWTFLEGDDLCADCTRFIHALRNVVVFVTNEKATPPPCS